ncbi:penicillin-binding protein activator [Enterobacter hormaechei]|nr:penicillin-binding protein activator [Enterobacter hormaechei]
MAGWLAGWLALRRAWSDNGDTPDRLKAAVSAWQTIWQQHQSARQLPTALVNDMNFCPASVRKVALTLPLSGPAARFVLAIQQGGSRKESDPARVRGKLRTDALRHHNPVGAAVAGAGITGRHHAGLGAAVKKSRGGAARQQPHAECAGAESARAPFETG